MIFVNVNEILHFLFGFFARRKLKRQAQTEETGYQVEGRAEIPSMLASQPFQVTTSTSVNIPPFSTSSQTNTRTYGGSTYDGAHFYSSSQTVTRNNAFTCSLCCCQV
jgi:hypothetical protein